MDSFLIGLAMVRKHRKMSFYEVIGKTRLKSSYGKTLQQSQPGKTAKDEPIATDSTTHIAGRATRLPTRPRVVQFNAGRIEISIPYQLAVALLLGLVLLVLVAFRLGQINQRAAESAGKMPESGSEAAGEATAGIAQIPALAEKTASVPASVEKAEPVMPRGNNRIVIQTWQTRAQLEPVRDYFAQFGIETEIKKIDNWWYLVTKDKYENPEKPGTDGYSARQKIIRLGAKYKAPPGYGSFGPKPFHDAYGMRFDD